MKAAIRKNSSSDTLKRKSIKGKDTFVSDAIGVSAFRNNDMFVQRKAGCACGGGCPRCNAVSFIQPKLKIGQPNDKYEQEAERVADEVMRMREPCIIQRAPT